MKPNSLILFLALALCLSGCNNLSGPRETLASAYQDLMKGELKAFDATLSGDALMEYGMPQAAARLKERLTGLNLETGLVEHISSEPNEQGGWNVRYAIQVTGKSESGQARDILNAGILCQYQPSPSCIGPWQPNTPIDCADQYSVICTIHSIQ